MAIADTSAYRTSPKRHRRWPVESGADDFVLAIAQFLQSIQARPDQLVDRFADSFDVTSRYASTYVELP